jgi:hypothetical protein
MELVGLWLHKLPTLCYCLLICSQIHNPPKDSYSLWFRFLKYLVSDLSDEKYLLLIMNVVASSLTFFVVCHNLVFLWVVVLVITLEMKRGDWCFILIRSMKLYNNSLCHYLFFFFPCCLVFILICIKNKGFILMKLYYLVFLFVWCAVKEAYACMRRLKRKCRQKSE